MCYLTCICRSCNYCIALRRLYYGCNIVKPYCRVPYNVHLLFERNSFVISDSDSGNFFSLHMSTLAEELASALALGTCLLETSSTPSNSLDLKSVLHSRLLKYYACLESGDGVKEELRESSTLEEMQFLTAKEALSVVQKVHHILDIEDAKTNGTPDQVPSIGTRDLAQLRTLLSLVFKWGIEPLFNRVVLASPVISTASTKAKIVDVSQGTDAYQFLFEFVTSVFLLIFPRGIQGQVSQTLITTTILHRHVSDLLNPSIALGWFPEPLSSNSFPIMHEMRPFVIHLLKLYV
jgi:hypothetical protein